MYEDDLKKIHFKNKYHSNVSTSLLENGSNFKAILFSLVVLHNNGRGWLDPLIILFSLFITNDLMS